MEISQAAQGLSNAIPPNWSASWMVGLPLIVLTVVFHVLGLGLIDQRALRAASGKISPSSNLPIRAGRGCHDLAGLHPARHRGGNLGPCLPASRCLPDFKSAMLYSLNAMTSYGHARLALELHWELLGAVEALNGWLLFGLTTAFLFGVIHRVWSLDGRGSAVDKGSAGGY